MNVTLHINGKPVTLENVERKQNELRFQLKGKRYAFRSQPTPEGGFVLEQESDSGAWQRSAGAAWASGRSAKRVKLGALEAVISEMPASGATSTGAAALSPTAPMPGVVRQVLVKKGEKVAQGQPLVIVEAMKLQLTLAAGGDATVESVLVKEGEMVSEGAELVRLIAKK